MLFKKQNKKRRSKNIKKQKKLKSSRPRTDFATFLPPSRSYKGNGYKLSAQQSLGLFEWSSVTYDWLMVALNTKNQSQLYPLIHQNNPRNHCAQRLYLFSLEFLKWDIPFSLLSLLNAFHVA